MRRRELLAAAAAATLVRPATAAAAVSEGDVLVRLLAREDAAALAYREAPVPLGADLAVHESEHAAALRTNLESLTRRIPEPPERLDPDARRVTEAEGEARLRAALALEEALIGAYRAALLELEAAGIVQTAGSILASHVQHRHLLLRQLP